MGRSILGFLAGAAIAMVVITVVHTINNFMHPLPEGLSMSDTEGMREHIKSLPPSAFVMVVLAWSAGALAGGWLAGRIAGRSSGVHGLAVGLLLVLGAVFNMLVIPHPGWVWVAGIVLPAACGYLGGLLARRPAAGTPAGGAVAAQG